MAYIFGTIWLTVSFGSRDTRAFQGDWLTSWEMGTALHNKGQFWSRYHFENNALKETLSLYSLLDGHVWWSPMVTMLLPPTVNKLCRPKGPGTYLSRWNHSIYPKWVFTTYTWLLQIMWFIKADVHTQNTKPTKVWLSHRFNLTENNGSKQQSL